MKHLNTNTMTTQNFKIGTKFTNIDLPEYVKTIVNITDTRIIYNDGKKHYTGSSNRRQLNSWLTIKGFEKKLASRELIIIN